MDSNRIVVTGGTDNLNYFDTTWIYNIPKDIYENGPILNKKRAYHGCAKFSRNSGKEVLIVAGGYSDGKSKAEIWPFAEGYPHWELCKFFYAIRRRCKTV